MVRGLTSAYAYTIANILQREIKETRENAPRDKTRKDVIFERFIWLLLQHYERERKVEFYANQLHVTPKHLATVVKNEWENSCRMDRWVTSFLKQRLGLNIRLLAFKRWPFPWIFLRRHFSASTLRIRRGLPRASIESSNKSRSALRHGLHRSRIMTHVLRKFAEPKSWYVIHVSWCDYL